MTPTLWLATAMLATSTARAEEYAELYDDDYRNDAEALQMARAAGIFVEPLPAALPRTVSVDPVQLDVSAWQQSRATLDAETQAGIATHIGNMLRLRLLREGFEVVDTGADARVTLTLALDACVVPETKKSIKAEQAGTYPCVSAGSSGSGLSLAFVGDGFASTIQKRRAPMSSGRQTVDRAIFGSDARWNWELPKQPWPNLDVNGEAGGDVRLALNLGEKVLGYAFAVWADETRALRESAGLVRRVDDQHPVPPLAGIQGCYVGSAKSVIDGMQHDGGLRLAYHPADGRMVTDELNIAGGAVYQDRQLVSWAVDGATAEGESHLYLVDSTAALTLSLEGEPWAWTRWTISPADGWTRSYTRTETGLEVIDDYGPRIGVMSYTLERVDEAGCAAVFEKSAPPRDWPHWAKEATAPVAPPAASEGAQ